jgi:hypothetical protein
MAVMVFLGLAVGDESSVAELVAREQRSIMSTVIEARFG